MKFFWSCMNHFFVSKENTPADINCSYSLEDNMDRDILARLAGFSSGENRMMNGDGNLCDISWTACFGLICKILAWQRLGELVVGRQICTVSLRQDLLVYTHLSVCGLLKDRIDSCFNREASISFLNVLILCGNDTWNSSSPYAIAILSRPRGMGTCVCQRAHYLRCRRGKSGKEATQSSFYTVGSVSYPVKQRDILNSDS